MKAIVISNKLPKYDFITRKGKEILIKETKPKIETPFKCYVYQTEQDASKIYTLENGCEVFPENASGKVVGEFICDKIEDVSIDYNAPQEFRPFSGNSKPLYAWFVSNLKVYNKPKELIEFYKPCDFMKREYCLCGAFCETSRNNANDIVFHCNFINPPKRWEYCEELEEKKNE